MSRSNAGKIICKDTKLFKKNCLRHEGFQEGWHQNRNIGNIKVLKESNLRALSRTKIFHLGN